MTNTLRIPKKLRITFRHQETYEVDGDPSLSHQERYEKRIVTVLPRLGFANIYDPHTKAYAAREETQDDWAYGTDYGPRPSGLFIDENGKYWTRRSKWVRRPGTEHLPYDPDFNELVTTETIVPDDLQPIIIDNEPMEGFKIQHLVARDRGNKLWRILDPRGFELELTSGTFEDLVMTGMVDKGQIIGPCVWRTGKVLTRV